MLRILMRRKRLIVYMGILVIVSISNWSKILRYFSSLGYNFIRKRLGKLKNYMRRILSENWL